MYPARTITSIQARETIDRLSTQTASLRTYGVAPEALIVEFNDALTAFVPREKLRLFHIGKESYVGDTTLPGAYVPGSLFRRRLERARTDFDTLLLERHQQSPQR